MSCSWDKSTAPLADWHAVMTDATGQYVYSLIWGGAIYKSTDYGVTWAATSSPNQAWADGMCTKAGNRVVATVYGGGIYYSNDYGNTWIQSSAPWNYWLQVTNAAFNANIWVAGNNEGVHASSDGGLTWTSLNPPNGIYDRVASNAQGTQFYAYKRNADLFTYKTSNPGWTKVYSASTVRFVIVTPNTNQAVMTTSTGVFTSSDAGATWVAKGTPLDFVWLAGDVTGQYLTAVVSGGGLYVSSDFGATWVDQCPIGAQWAVCTSMPILPGPVGLFTKRFETWPLPRLLPRYP